MPIILKKNIIPYGEIGVWRVEEDTSYFADQLDLSDQEIKTIEHLKGRKLQEWLSSRLLLHVMSGRKNRAIVNKDLYGKPYLADSHWHISLSHSRDLSAVIASPNIVGIDIQYFVSKISRIARKFINESEQKLIITDNELFYYHFIWGSKECLFKAYGKGQVDFRKHLEVKEIKTSQNIIRGKGIINKPDFNEKFTLIGEIFEDYILVYCIMD